MEINEINQTEYFLILEFEVKHLITGLNIPQNYDYYKMKNKEMGNANISFSFADNKYFQTVFEPYRDKLFAKCRVI